MRKKKWDVSILCMVLLLTACITGCGREDGEETMLTCVGEADMEKSIGEKTEEELRENAGEEAASGEVSGTLYIDVCGEVNFPGVYELPPGSRVYEAVEKAGGMTEKAAASSLNQAEKLTDGQQVYVPSGEEAEGQAAGREGTAGLEGISSDGKVNINTASKEELMTLTGIGEVKAESIIRYREEQGSFQSVEDIKKIEGIKEGVFSKIKDQIKI